MSPADSQQESGSGTKPGPAGGQPSRASQDYDRLLGGLSHQLRTPLTTIAGLTEILLYKEGLDSPTQRRFLEKIHDQVSRMRAVLDELRTLSRLESFSDAGELELLDLLVPVADAVQGLVQSAEDKGLKLEISTPSDPILIRGDGGSLRIMVFNLLDNAIKYTRYGGRIEVSVQVQSGAANVIIKDNGIGIAEEEQELVFERFFRGEKARDLQRQGSGLGLAIVREIVGSHNGNISLNSAHGAGSAFSVRLPLADR